MSDSSSVRDQNSSISWRSAWIGVGVLWIALVVFLSIVPISLPQMPSTIGDKINHAIAYGFLMLWFGQIYHSFSRRCWLALLFISLGILMEVIQGTLKHRWFDLADALANSVGVVLALTALWFGADKGLSTIERRLNNRKHNQE